MDQSNNSKDTFLEQLQQSLENGTFIKVTLSKKGNKSSDLKNVYGRLVEIKSEVKFSMQIRYETRDEVKNIAVKDVNTQMDEWLGHDFLNADLFTSQKDYSLQYNKKRKARLFERPASQPEKPSLQHNRDKNRMIEAHGNPYLPAMGVTNQQGEILKAGHKKYRQINKYVEIIDALVRQQALPNDAHIVDMGSGKGYLTFALYDYLRNQQSLRCSITGIELRPKLVEFCNDLADQCDYEELAFLSKDIHDYHPEKIDMLIALHACDIATDIAIAKGILAKAKIIVVAPCCHKQVRKAMKHNNSLSAVLKHGILEERQAELLTDGIRSLMLEAHGYQTKVFEFISTEHTSKNLMITAVQGKPQKEAFDKIEEIKKEYGIEYHYLEKLLPSQ
ncbi:MAG: SAM-dependent methyltransferase [Saprospiraceae bacterium]|nr:SAM-dependent methyltransferase [Saprospiraceae bacterium]